ncbi:UNVERIFIED_CONTAM: hypothetical protein NCL1_10776 [Trichonephila clavipes]
MDSCEILKDSHRLYIVYYNPERNREAILYKYKVFISAVTMCTKSMRQQKVGCQGAAGLPVVLRRRGGFALSASVSHPLPH